MHIRDFTTIVLTAVILIACRYTEHVEGSGIASAWPDLSASSVYYGFDGERLRFVTFETVKQGTPGMVTAAYKFPQNGRHQSKRFITGSIQLPDGTVQDLLASQRVYEWSYGKFTNAEITFTKSELLAYLDAEAKPPTINGLRRFLELRK